MHSEYSILMLDLSTTKLLHTLKKPTATSIILSIIFTFTPSSSHLKFNSIRLDCLLVNYTLCKNIKREAFKRKLEEICTHANDVLVSFSYRTTNAAVTFRLGQSQKWVWIQCTNSLVRIQHFVWKSQLNSAQEKANSKAGNRDTSGKHWLCLAHCWV